MFVAARNRSTLVYASVSAAVLPGRSSLAPGAESRVLQTVHADGGMRDRRKGRAKVNGLPDSFVSTSRPIRDDPRGRLQVALAPGMAGLAEG
jgi:hypothetical protein